jgi:hypothetical protein
MNHASSTNLSTILKISGMSLAILLLSVVLIAVAIGLYQTRKMERSANQAKFRGGQLPNPLPDGPYKGNAFTGLGRNWQGKVFNRSQSTGINQFADGQRYAFKTYAAAGLRDKDRQVLRIDYNQSGNPLWLRFIVDEIVQTSPGHYLGKIHVKIIPGLPFSLGYFELSSK